jgi:hypothetical protein
MYTQRNFAIFSVEELDKIDFNFVLESSAETVRKNIAGTKTFVKWDEGPFDPTPYEVIDAETGETTIFTPQPPGPPSFIAELTTLEGIYSYTEILEILNGPEWSAPMPMGEE